MMQVKNIDKVKDVSAVERELKTFNEKVDSLSDLTTVISLAVIAVGAVSALALGPIAFLAGSALGSGFAFGLKQYIHAKKKDIAIEVKDLEINRTISSNEASHLTDELGKIYTDKAMLSSVE